MNGQMIDLNSSQDNFVDSNGGQRREKEIFDVRDRVHDEVLAHASKANHLKRVCFDLCWAMDEYIESQPVSKQIERRIVVQLPSLSSQQAGKWATQFNATQSTRGCLVLPTNFSVFAKWRCKGIASDGTEGTGTRSKLASPTGRS